MCSPVRVPDHPSDARLPGLRVLLVLAAAPACERVRRPSAVERGAALVEGIPVEFKRSWELERMTPGQVFGRREQARRRERWVLQSS